MIWHCQVCRYSVSVDCLQVGWTALIQASYKDHIDVVLLLLATHDIIVSAADEVIALKQHWSSPLLMHGKYGSIENCI
jgi:hypothetical protein